MKLDEPLDARYGNVDGPIAAYREADAWTQEMRQDLEAAFQRSDKPANILAELRPITYRCPKCEQPQEEIRFDSLLFYADEDFNRMRPVGEAQLITMVTCGHQFRREVSP